MSAWQPTLPASPINALARSCQMTDEIPMNLSWNERRKLKRYMNQVQKDAAKSAKQQERIRQREEKAAAKQWKQYYKAQEKETKKWRKATAHHPEMNHACDTASIPSQQSHHHTFHLHSPHVTHAPAYQPTRPLPHAFQTNPDSFLAQYLPIDGDLGGPEQSAPLLPSLEAFGVVNAGAGQGVQSPVMSRTMTHALLGLDRDTYLRFGQRGLIR
ncbi:hypothetical protein NliqN6_2464 [Naganishia liquefaciens]|uniref:Uncharacterized protein n=1 Tax=Naganishia liquefaciens TaxID=104408 RepID=A0A8H3TRW4_9TREE|nr:hypothetical protein NliqN6_2464 [Naganishia liquefaciens]